LPPSNIASKSESKRLAYVVTVGPQKRMFN
jgi:hypothetical protein